MNIADVMYEYRINILCWHEPVIFKKKILNKFYGELQSKFSTVIQSKFWFEMCIFAKIIVMYINVLDPKKFIHILMIMVHFSDF